jgi:pimeloyl-ACP methyl ester carboxylesterase
MPKTLFLVIFIWRIACQAAPQAVERRIRVNGHELFLRCTGTGVPVVILEAGLSDSTEVWGRVQELASDRTRVCSYDRLGNGKSGRAGRTRNPLEAVADLRALLDKAGVPPPYVLVGHSYGGLLVRLFAHRYPTQVVGMVVVDSSHEGLTAPAGGASSVMMTREPLDLAAGFTSARQQAWHADIPLLVLARHRTVDELPPGVSDAVRQKIVSESDAEQNELARRSSQGKIRWISNASHYIQRDQPETVANAIRQVLEEVSHLPARPQQK